MLLNQLGVEPPPGVLPFHLFLQRLFVMWPGSDCWPWDLGISVGHITFSPLCRILSFRNLDLDHCKPRGLTMEKSDVKSSQMPQKDLTMLVRSGSLAHIWSIKYHCLLSSNQCAHMSTPALEQHCLFLKKNRIFSWYGMVSYRYI